MDKRVELINLIRKSGIADSDKKEWEFLINSSSDELIENYSDLFSKFPNEVNWFNDIYKRKKRAFAVMKDDIEKAKKMFQDIFGEEKKKLVEFKNQDKN